MTSTLRFVKDPDEIGTNQSGHTVAARVFGLEPPCGADPEELLAIAEYLVPAGSGCSLSGDAQLAAAQSIAEWAEGDTDALRRAWASALRRSRQGEARRTAAQLLSEALKLADPLPPHGSVA